MKTRDKLFLMSPCQWDHSGGHSCTWICFNNYLSIIYFIWFVARYATSQTHVSHNVTRSAKLQGTQRSPELAFRSTDFLVPENLILPATLEIISKFHFRILNKFFIAPEIIRKPIWFHYGFLIISWWVEVN